MEPRQGRRGPAYTFRGPRQQPGRLTSGGAALALAGCLPRAPLAASVCAHSKIRAVRKRPSSCALSPRLPGSPTSTDVELWLWTLCVRMR